MPRCQYNQHTLVAYQTNVINILLIPPIFFYTLSLFQFIILVLVKYGTTSTPNSNKSFVKREIIDG